MTIHAMTIDVEDYFQVQAFADRIGVIAQTVALPRVQAGAGADVPVRVEVEVAVHAGGPAVQLGLAVIDDVVAVEDVLDVDVAQVVVAGLDTQRHVRVDRPAVAAVEGVAGVVAVVRALVDRGAADIAVDEPAAVVRRCVLREGGGGGQQAGGDESEGK